MKINAFNIGVLRSGIPPKILLIMKLIAIIMTTFLIQVSAAGFAQKVTLKERNAELQSVLQKIRAQTGYDFLFDFSVIENAKKVSVEINNLNIDQALDELFKDQNLSYSIKDKSVVIKIKEPSFLDKVVDAFTPPVDISGLVLDEKGLPLAGVTVRVKGSGKATSTGNDGRFYLAGVDDDAVIEIRMVGYKTLERTAKGKFERVQMEQLSNDLDETIVVAYGTTTQRSNIGALTVVKGEEVQTLPNRSVDKSLQGLVPGLLVTSGNGQPGAGLSNFVLRGISTGDNGLNGSTVRNPLIVMDGIPVSQESPQISRSITGTPVTNPMAQLNPSDIESITVLKDAAAVALYGSKASNGVILITTKRGKAGKTIVSFRHQTDLNLAIYGNTELVSLDKYLDLLYETYRNTPRVLTTGETSVWTDADILADLKSKFPVRSDGSLYPLTDWEKEFFKNQASTLSNELSFSGGNEKNLFYLNFEYTKQNGIIKGSGYDRKSIRFNFENKPAKWFSVGMNSTLSYNIQDYKSQVISDGGNALRISPLNPAYLENGDLLLNFTFPNIEANPLAIIKYNTRKNIVYRGLSKLYGELSFLKHFKLRSALGIDFSLTEAREKLDPRVYDPELRTLTGRIWEVDTRNANLITTNTLQYNHLFANDHAVNITLGQEAQIITNKFLSAMVTGLQVPTDDQISSNGTGRTSTGIHTKQTQLSYFGQVNYSYRNKYFLTGSIRNDGSSRFGERNRNGNYWSAGAGWVVSEESFMKRSSNWLDYLKIRGSIGAAGNSFAIDRLTRFDVLRYSVFQGKPAVVPFGPGNPDIKWEETYSTDAGLEARLLKNRLSFTVDFYKKFTSNLIYSTPLPLSTGWGAVLNNIGDMNNTGIELSLSANILKLKDFAWNINGNWRKNKNILVKADVPLSTITGNLLANEEGRNFNSFYLVRWAGVNPINGQVQWLNEADQVTTVIPSTSSINNNRKFVGKPQPDGFGSLTNTFSYKGISLSAMFYFQYGYQIYNSTSLLNDGASPYMLQDKRALQSWQKPGDVAANPKRMLNNFVNLGNSTRFLYDGDHIRLQNVMLSYLVPTDLLKKLHLSMVRVYAQGQNLALWTKYPAGDPADVTVQGLGDLVYPNQASFSLGLNVNF